jgi:cell division control protein 11
VASKFDFKAAVAAAAADDEHASKASRPRTNPRVTPRYHKLLVVGANGLGKTAFIHNLFEPYNVDKKVAFKVHDGSSTSLQDFTDDPGSMCTVLRDIPLNDSMSLHISIQDTPGYGDDLNTATYLKRIVGFIMGQWRADYDANQGAFTAPSLTAGTLVHSVSACIFFLPPHRASKIDSLLIAALSKLVPVIPVISKADAMTSSELQAYRRQLRQDYFHPGCTAEGIPMHVHCFPPEHLAAVGVEQEHFENFPPFAVISSTDVDRSNGGYQPKRAYNWGTCNTLDRRHSDTIVLKRLLTGDKVSHAGQHCPCA